MVVCPLCKSKRIFHLCIDSDWGLRMGVYKPINDSDCYTPEELFYDANDRPDVELFECLDCHKNMG